MSLVGKRSSNRYPGIAHVYFLVLSVLNINIVYFKRMEAVLNINTVIFQGDGGPSLTALPDVSCPVITKENSEELSLPTFSLSKLLRNFAAMLMANLCPSDCK